MHIGLLFEYDSLNGGEHSMLAALDKLLPRQIQITAFTPGEGPLTSELKRRRIETIAFDVKLLSSAEQLAILRQFVAQNGLQLLHANSLAMGRKLGKLSANLSVPTTSHLRDIIKLKQTVIADLNQHKQLFAVSKATREYHVHQGVEPSRVTTLYNGIDTDRFSPRSVASRLKPELGLKNETQLASTIGQICLRKGQLDLAEAAVLLKDKLPNLHYLIVGERHSLKTESIAFDEQITATFQQAGMGHRLHRLGYRDDIAGLLNEIDLLIHPARQEPLGRVLLEAASSGVPIVATDVGGTPEILTHQQSALLVPANDTLALADAIHHLLLDPRQTNQFATRARQHIVEQFDIENSSQLLWESWSCVINSAE